MKETKDENIEFPYGAEFSPDKVSITDLLNEASSLSGDNTQDFCKAVAAKYFNKNLTMGQNCKNSMVAYNILEEGGGVHLSEFGRSLLTRSEQEIYSSMGKHILHNLNGLIFIDAIRAVSSEGQKPSIERVTEAINLITSGKKIAKTSKTIPTMKKWLEKAHVLSGWEINEEVLEELCEMPKDEINVLRDLSENQIAFVLALCNTDFDDFQKASTVRKLATSTYNVTYSEKGFSTSIINPLIEKGIIEKKESPIALSHGGNSPEIKISLSTKDEILCPVLEQLRKLAGAKVLKYIKLPLAELRDEINSNDKYIKGLALEAFTIKIMRIIGLDFCSTRLRGADTGGAEVDIIFDTTRLCYSRWQVQCKNTPTVSLDQVAKEVGLAYMLKSNVIVIMTTGKASSSAKQYAKKIMEEMNLSIFFIEGKDIDKIIDAPANFINILTREAKKSKSVKTLEDK